MNILHHNFAPTIYENFTSVFELIYGKWKFENLYAYFIWATEGIKAVLRYFLWIKKHTTACTLKDIRLNYVPHMLSCSMCLALSLVSYAAHGSRSTCYLAPHPSLASGVSNPTYSYESHVLQLLCFAALVFLVFELFGFSIARARVNHIVTCYFLKRKVIHNSFSYKWHKSPGSINVVILIRYINVSFFNNWKHQEKLWFSTSSEMDKWPLILHHWERNMMSSPNAAKIHLTLLLLVTYCAGDNTNLLLNSNISKTLRIKTVSFHKSSIDIQIDILCTCGSSVADV